MKSIQHLTNKIKGSGGVDRSLIFYIFIVILVSLGSFFLGRISINRLDNEKVSIVNTTGKGDLSTNFYKNPTEKFSPNTSSTSDNSGVYVASKNGKMYYRIGCGASTRIKEENKIYFEDMKDAESAGFQASTSCTP